MYVVLTSHQAGQRRNVLGVLPSPTPESSGSQHE